MNCGYGKITAMKRLAAALMILFMVSGCTKITDPLSARLDAKTEEVLQAPVQPANNRKLFYSYYADPSVGRISSTATGNVFSCDGITFVMNLDAGRIVNEKYYPDASDTCSHQITGDIAAEKKGIMTDRSGNEKEYHIVITRISETDYLVSLRAADMSFSAVTGEADAPSAAAAMLKIARSVTVDHNEVMAAYSSREGIDYLGTPVELFEETAPENGSIEELLVGYDGRSAQPAQEENQESEQENNSDESVGEDAE